MNDAKARELHPEQLRRTIDPRTLTFDGAEERAGTIVGQERAIAALRFGLDVHSSGYNIYVAGPPGIGKMTTVRAFVEDLARRKPTPDDWCYLNNFDDPYQPMAVRLPAGQGRRLEQDMRALVDQARREIPRAFEGDEYGTHREQSIKDLAEQREALFNTFGERAIQAGFALQPTPVGIAIMPTSHGRPLNDEEFAALSEQERSDLLQRREGLEVELKALMKRGRALERTAQERLTALDQQVARFVIGGLLEDLHERYHSLPQIAAYLSAVQDDMLGHIDLFRTQSGQHEGPPEVGLASAAWLRDLPFRRYAVNVLVDNSRREGAPAIVELNPGYSNLFGRIERESLFGAISTDFTLIRPGALHRANGGFLVLAMEDLLRDPFSWDALKRALRGAAMEIEDPTERLGIQASKSLRPQPVPLDMKVVLVGPPLLYYLLQTYDPEFPELFKVQADFDTRMPWSEENVRGSLNMINGFCKREGLRPLAADGAAALLEHAVRLAEDQERISTHFGALTDLVREAEYWAAKESAPTIGADHIQCALAAKEHRSDLIRERQQELITRGSLRIDTQGEQIGQVNGLSVISLGDYSFGRPSRISATVAPGREGLVDIEREVKLGGPIHSKGVMILGGYLLRRFAHERPLALTARLVFEQSYEGVEGDSASAAELCALLSALAGAPIRQAIAITGSVDQAGRIQAIGGVNEKIEGFFAVCHERGLTGDQGVIVPHTNQAQLMLRPEVVGAVAEGRFHIWTVETVEQAAELLTGLAIGERDTDGHYPEGTLGALAEARLLTFATNLREMAGPKTEQS